MSNAVRNKTSIADSEITVRGVLLGLFLAVLLGASSAYLGLKMGRTVSASIPAAMISMIVLRRFKNSSILENNMVQTLASAGESVAGGVIFIFPAVVIMGYWKDFDYWYTACIITLGGVLGVVLSVPLRRVMIIKENLPYPEGLAVAKILQAGDNKDSKDAVKSLGVGAMIGSVMSFLQTGFQIASERIHKWVTVGQFSTGYELYLSPILVSAGYIAGIKSSLSYLFGSLCTYLFAIPVFITIRNISYDKGVEATIAAVHKAEFKYVAVGVMLVGGIWSLITLSGRVFKALKSSMSALNIQSGNVSRVDRDIPFKYIVITVACMIGPMMIFLDRFLSVGEFAQNNKGTILFVSIVSCLVLSFLAAVIAAYIVGSVGTTSLPVSGVTIGCLFAFSLVLLNIVGSEMNFAINNTAALQAAGFVIMIGAICCVAITMGGDNLQDLKAGHLVGATPWKQQVMLIFGVIASALFIPYVLQMVFMAYGIGDVMPHDGMDPSKTLPAPQAHLMATVASGMFSDTMNTTMLHFGIKVGIILICIELAIRAAGFSNFRLSVILFGLGVYLPLGYAIAFFIGSYIKHVVDVKKAKSNKNAKPKSNDEAVDDHATDHGVLFASGVIAGESILGAVLTIPFAISQDQDMFALADKSFEYPLAVGCFVLMCYVMFKYGMRAKRA